MQAAVSISALHLEMHEHRDAQVLGTLVPCSWMLGYTDHFSHIWNVGSRRDRPNNEAR